MLFGIVALVLVAQTWIIFGIVMGQAPKKNVDPACLIAIVSGIFALISCIIGLINGVNVPLKPFFQCAGILTIGGFVNAFQLTLMSKAMQRGPNGIIWSITQSGFIIPFIIGILFFNSEAGIIRYTGFALTIISLFLIGITQKTEKKEYSNWLLLTFGAFVITGISQTLSNIPSYFNQYNEISSVWRSCFSLVGMTLGALFSPFTDGSYKNYGSLLKENFLKNRYNLIQLLLIEIIWNENEICFKYIEYFASLPEIFPYFKINYKFNYNKLFYFFDSFLCFVSGFF
jgi:multidrug transporter EmrE-like cation transporter